MPVPCRRIPAAVGYFGWRQPRLYSFGIADPLNPKYPTAHHRKGSYRLEKNDMAPARIPSERGIFPSGLSFSENRIREICGPNRSSHCVVFDDLLQQLSIVAIVFECHVFSDAPVR
jgi:hypothetical protein